MKVLTISRIFPVSIVVAFGKGWVEDKEGLICTVLIFFLKVGEQYSHVTCIMKAHVSKHWQYILEGEIVGNYFTCTFLFLISTFFKSLG